MLRPLTSSLIWCFGVLQLAYAAAEPTHIDLSGYQLAAMVNLPAFVDEASAIAYNPDTGNLYIIGDEGLGIGEFTRAGAFVGSMTFTGFEDTEGIAYAGNGQFVIAEERLQDLFLLTYVRFGTVARSALQSVSLGATIGNEGIEGVCRDPVTGTYLAVKERTPARVLSFAANFAAGTATPVDLFLPASLGVTDLADIAALAAVPSLVGTADQDNLLIISQESARVVKCTRAGVVLGTLSLAGLSTTAEGITIDEQGVIYIVDETPRLFIFEPPCAADFDGNDVVEVGDVFVFLTAWFAGVPAAYSFGGTPGVPAIFAFLTEWFAGCP